MKLPSSRSLRTSLACLALGAAVGVALVAQGCEAIVPESVSTPSCSMTPYVDPGNGTCPAGMYCEGAGCKACESKDFCDGYDNDCDGIIDDGPYSDKDGDGYTYCGKIDQTTGATLDRDCDDTNPKIFPGGHEICNGKDDNCDGIIDNANLVCPPDETCVPQTGACVSNEQVCTTATCPPPDVCDPGTNACVPPGTQDAGTSCSGNLACTTGICSDPAELGPTPGLATCTSVCCTSDDCSAGSICWGAGTGGNYCIPGSAVGRRALGTGEQGTSCSTAGDCRSGVCTGSICQDTCCGDSTCEGGTTCAATTFAGNTTLACTATGTTPANEKCSADADCASGYCSHYCDNQSCSEVTSLCAEPCCSSSQCGSYEGNQFVCQDDYFPPLSPPSFTAPASGPVVGVCDAVQQLTPTGQAPTGKVGTPCSGSTDCYSNLCNITSGTTGYCTDVCCKDADCATAGYVCRPTQQSNGTYLRCVANSSTQ
jgi:Putative metal-binding motif